MESRCGKLVGWRFVVSLLHSCCRCIVTVGLGATTGQAGLFGGQQQTQAGLALGGAAGGLFKAGGGMCLVHLFTSATICHILYYVLEALPP